LRHGGDREIAKILNAPEFFAAALDPLADNAGRESGA
jgi:hypothetical protein